MNQRSEFLKDDEHGGNVVELDEDELVEYLTDMITEREGLDAGDYEIRYEFSGEDEDTCFYLLAIPYDLKSDDIEMWRMLMETDLEDVEEDYLSDGTLFFTLDPEEMQDLLSEYASGKTAERVEVVNDPRGAVAKLYF